MPLEDEEGAVGVLPLVVGERGPLEQSRVPVDRAVEVGDVEVNRGDEAHVAGFVFPRDAPTSAACTSLAFFLLALAIVPPAARAWSLVP